MIDDKICSGCSSWPCRCITLDEWEVELLEKRIAELERMVDDQAGALKLAVEFGVKMEESAKKYRAALEKLVNSSVVKDAPFIGYSEAYLGAIEALG